MSEVSALLVSPHLIDLVIVFTFVEAVLLLWLRRRGNRNGIGTISPAAIGFMLLPGVFLLLAARAALADAAWPWVPAALAAALVAHLLDLRTRWSGSAGAATRQSGAHTKPL